MSSKAANLFAALAAEALEDEEVEDEAKASAESKTLAATSTEVIFNPQVTFN